MSYEIEFLTRAVAAARQGGHVFPQMAACEAALESAWGRSTLAREANNLFGQKQDRGRTQGIGTLRLPTREYLHHQWVNEEADWVKFPDWASAFAARMEILRALSPEFPTYARALQAQTPEQFVQLVSQRWSTDPERARKVVSIYDEHQTLLTTLSPGPSNTPDSAADSSQDPSQPARTTQA